MERAATFRPAPVDQPMAAASPKLPSLVDQSESARVNAGKRPQRKRTDAGSSRVALKVAVAVGLLLVSAVLLIRTLGGDDPAAASRRRIAIDSLTNEVLEITVGEGSRPPWRNPKTGGDTLYPAEACYWNKDGTAKLKPTYVFVKEYAGIDEDTYCPDCGRLVVPHNPMPPDHLLLEAAERGDKGGR